MHPAAAKPHFLSPDANSARVSHNQRNWATGQLGSGQWAMANCPISRELTIIKKLETGPSGLIMGLWRGKHGGYASPMEYSSPITGSISSERFMITGDSSPNLDLAIIRGGAQ